MKKKLLTVLLAGCMVLSMTACGSKEAENQTEQTGESVADETGTEEEAEDTTAIDASVMGTSTLTKLGEYAGLTYSPVDTTVTDEEIETEIQYLLSSYPTKEAQEVVGEDSYVNIDYVGTKDGVAFDGGTASSQELSIANSGYIEGFAESIVGMKVGETKDCPMTFPEDYGVEELNGADVVFTITVNDCWKNIPSEFNDEFAVAQGYENADALYAQIKENLELSKQEDADYTKETELLDKIIAASEFDINDDEVQYYVQQLQYQHETIAYNYYGMDLESFVAAAYGMTMEAYNAKCEESGLYSIQETLVKRAVAEAEGMTLTEEEYQAGAEVYMTASGYSTMEDFEAATGKENIEDQLLMDKAADYIMGNAVLEAE